MASIELRENTWERWLPPLAVSLLAALFVAVLYRTAWLCDDAYITYRSIDNAVNGYGLRFNTVERVQTFTHPLWMLLHLPLRAISGNMYAVGMLVALSSTLAAMGWFLLRLTRTFTAMAFVLLTATLSKSFMDYSSSGLENPMTHLLIVVFAGIWLLHPPGRRRLFWLAFVTGLALTNRMDTLLLFAPALGLEFWRQRSWRNVWTVTSGLSVFLLWEAFSVLYYGFPFPNTAYAKLSHGFESSLIWKQGFYYLWNSLSRDPITLLTVLTAAILPFVYRQKRLIPLVLGMLLYILYVIKIGGGFMSGRFFTGPFFLALIILAQLDMFPKNLRVAGPLLGLVLLLGWLPGRPTILSGKDYAPLAEGSIDAHGIADERAFYYAGTGLAHAWGQEVWPQFRWARDGRELAAKTERVHIAGNMGFLGYFAGPDKHLIDVFGLTDPLMARLPNRFMPDWRPGHFERMVPLGYKSTVESGKIQLKRLELQPLYGDLKLVTQGDLLSMARLKAMWRLNIGRPQAALDREWYFLPVTQEVNYAQLAKAAPMDSAWDAPGHTTFGVETGLKIALPEGLNFGALEVELCAKCWYIAVLRKNEKRLYSFVINGAAGPKMQRICEALPPDLGAQAPDELLLYTITDWRRCSLANLKFLNACVE